MSAFTSPISKRTHPGAPSRHAVIPPRPSAPAKTGWRMGALVVAAADQPGQWPCQVATPGTPGP